MKLLIGFLPLLLLTYTLPAEVQTSALWGEHGEKWTPESRLPDFSFAGYHEGKDPLPTPPVRLNVRDLGAVGDGKADDTAAFEKAIASIDHGAILIPAGRYKITRQLVINKPAVILQGQGRDKTVLFFPIPLETLHPDMARTTGGRPTSNYSWSGGMIAVNDHTPLPTIGWINTNAPRGSTRLQVKWTRPLQPGQRLEIVQHDPPDHSMIRYLYGGDSGNVSECKNLRISFVARVLSVDGEHVVIDRPLRTDVRPAWKAEVLLFDPKVTEVGIEHLTIEFPDTPYHGHFTEVGYNPLAFGNVSDCWGRDLRILNADSGPFVSGHFCTIDGIVYDSHRKPDAQGNTGHHGISLQNDSLCENFRFNTRFIHTLTVSNGASGNVFSHGSGVDVCFDNHCRAPFANLFTDIDCGKGTRLWHHGGGKDLGYAAGAWSTWWNLRADRPQTPPPPTYGTALLNFVGVTTSLTKPIHDPAGYWWETIAPDQLQSQNLYEAQKTRRLGKP